MFSLLRWTASAFGLAVALSFAMANEPLAAQAPAQDTAHKQMPMNMPMGKKAQKKTASGKPTQTKKAALAKKAGKIAKRSAVAQTGAKRKKPMGMPMGAQPHHAPTPTGQMQMADTGHAMHADSAHHDVGAMKTPAPAKTDSAKMSGMAGMPAMEMPSRPTDSTRMAMPGMRPRTADDMMIGPAGVSMERMGSGTTWIPDAVTLPSRRRMLGDWMLMAHGFVFAQYDKQSGERGDDQFGSLNWGMLMATHDFAGGRFQARTMLSLDPLTVTKRGYPLLLQTGESYKGEPLRDRQHPHDFWMELGALYQREINKGLAWSIYAAPSGEPALGPVAFMHRPSAMDNPTAPIAHHWQDATHVSFGVVTAGLFSHDWKLEGSVFNGREPDEHRWNFDPIKFDSYSGRFSFNPSRTWALSAGYGYMKSPEALHPDESMHRLTASAMHGVSIGADGQWASELVWGANSHSSHPVLAHSVTLETEAILDRHNTVLGRAEYVRKSAEDLALDEPPSNFPAAQSFNVEALSLGYIRELSRVGVTTIGLGGM